MSNHYAIITFRTDGGYVIFRLTFEQDSRQIYGYFSKVANKQQLNTAIAEWKQTQITTSEAELQQRIYRLDNKHYSVYLPPGWFDKGAFNPPQHRPKYGAYNIMLVFSNLTAMKLHLTCEDMIVQGAVYCASSEADLRYNISLWESSQHFPQYVEDDGKLRHICVPFLFPETWEKGRFMNPYR